MQQHLPDDELLMQPFVRQALAKYAEYLKQRIIDKTNNSTGEVSIRKTKDRSSQARKAMI